MDARQRPVRQRTSSRAHKSDANNIITLCLYQRYGKQTHTWHLQQCKAINQRECALRDVSSDVAREMLLTSVSDSSCSDELSIFFISLETSFWSVISLTAVIISMWENVRTKRNWLISAPLDRIRVNSTRLATDRIFFMRPRLLSNLQMIFFFSQKDLRIILLWEGNGLSKRTCVNRDHICIWLILSLSYWMSTYLNHMF